MTNQDENKTEPSEETPSSSEGEQNPELKTDESTLPPPDEEVMRLRSEMEEKDQAVVDAKERTLRALADLENYKKRIQKEQTEHAKFANERLVNEILPVIDNLERAISHSKEAEDPGNIIEGVELIHKGLLSALEKFNVRPIESLGKPFDPFHHQSVGQLEVEDGAEIEDNQVVVENQKGYFMGERVLRPALVLLSKKKTVPVVEEAPQNDQDKDSKS